MSGKMTSNRPYLIRAIYEWIEDNNLTTYIVVNASLLGVRVPKEYVKDGKIILNISSMAVRKLLISNQSVQFDARFSGKLLHIHTPVTAVMAIYAKENAQGMIFDEAVHGVVSSVSGDMDNHDEGDDGSPPPSGGGRKTSSFNCCEMTSFAKTKKQK